MKKPEAIIVDIDGTIADVTHRLEHIKSTNKNKRNWKKFNELQSQDKPIEAMLNLISAIDESDRIEIIFLTAREEKDYKTTAQWIIKHYKPYYAERVTSWLMNNAGLNTRPVPIYMRPNGDYRKDHLIKEEIYHNEIEPRFKVIAVFEDRGRCVEMWRKKGILCLQNDNWEEKEKYGLSKELIQELEKDREENQNGQTNKRLPNNNRDSTNSNNSRKPNSKRNKRNKPNNSKNSNSTRTTTTNGTTRNKLPKKPTKRSK